MRTFLLQPYPFGRSIARKLLVCVLTALFVALFLALFQPFGINELPPPQRWQHPALFGLVTFAVSALLETGLPRLLPGIFAEEGWKSWKEILFLLLVVTCIGAGNYALMNYLYTATTYNRTFGQVLWMTVQVGIFPVVAVVFMKELILYRRYATAAQEVNRQIDHTGTEPAVDLPAGSDMVRLQGEGQKEKLELSGKQLCFIASSDNYVQVVYQQGAATQSQLLRSSLKNIAQQVAEHPNLFRCHRMYLVNLERVVQVSGNAQGLRLHLKGLETTIPVSRSLTQTVRNQLAHLSHSPQNA